MALSSGHILEISRGETFLSGKTADVHISGTDIIHIPVPSYRIPKVKSSAGYCAGNGTDLIDLFIGQEGTLSVILEAEIGLPEKPAGIFSAFIFFDNEPDSWAFTKDARRAGPGVLSIEYFGENALYLVKQKYPNIPARKKAAIFLEEEIPVTGIGDIPDRWMGIMARHGASADDAWVAASERDADMFTQLRYAIPESINDILRREGMQKLATDIAVPEEHFMDMMYFYDSVLKKNGLRNVIFGHVGENHVHVNVLPRSESERHLARAVVMEFVKKAVSLDGTVSAEHGIGKLKHEYLAQMYGRQGILEMVRIKKALDPKWLLGQGNIFPIELSGIAGPL